jgi:hypothetical protein
MYKWMGHVWSRLLIVSWRCLVKENTISGTLGHVKPGENHAATAPRMGAVVITFIRSVLKMAHVDFLNFGI